MSPTTPMVARTTTHGVIVASKRVRYEVGRQGPDEEGADDPRCQADERPGPWPGLARVDPLEDDREADEPHREHERGPDGDHAAMIGPRRALVALALIVVAVALATLVLVRLPGPKVDPSASPSAGPSQATPPPQQSSIRSYPGPAFPSEPPIEPIGRSTQSRLWTIDGTWYGVAIDPLTRAAMIAVLSADGTTWTDTGTRIDERPGAMVDALWDGAALVTISAVPGRSTRNGVRVSRFQHDGSGGYRRDPNFPVRLTERGVSAATIARDTTGRLWAAFVQDGAVLVAHTTTDDVLWTVPGAVPGSRPVGEDDLAAVVATGDGRVALAWSDAPAGAVDLAIRADDADPEQWEPPETAFTGLPLAARPISVAAADGIVAIGIQTTAPADAPTGPSDPDSLLAVRATDGTWRTSLTSRIGDHLGSPVVALDPDGGEVMVLLTAPRGGGLVYLKRSPIERLDFPAGLGQLVMGDPAAPPDITGVSTGKSPVSMADPLVVTALDETSGIPWHALIAPPGTEPSPSTSPAPASPVPPSADPAARLLVDDDFAPWPVGAQIGNGWEIGPADGSATLVADGEASADRHARLRSSTAESVRACKAIPEVADGVVVVDLDILAEAIGDSDVVITSVRFGSSEAASVRFGQGGTFAYYAGAEKVRTTAPNRLERWLHSRVTVHLDTARYDWRLTTADGTRIVDARDIPFRESADGASSVCVGTSAGAGRPVVRFDGVRVAH